MVRSSVFAAVACRVYASGTCAESDTCSEETSLLQNTKKVKVVRHASDVMETVHSANPSFVGCFVDDGNRDLQDGPRRYGYTTATCADACGSYSHFALQNNGWCVCANDYSTESQYSQVPDNQCGNSCAGESSGRCGAGWRNAVYSVTPRADPDYVGCFIDDRNRDLQDGPRAYGYTSPSCAEACGSYSFFALQNNGWCVCGNAHSTESQYSQVDDSQCGNSCAGETSGHCGAGWRNAVYRSQGGSHLHHGASGSNSCGENSISASESDCLAAVQNLLPSGAAQGRTHLVAGSWGWVPPGCSVQSDFTHGRNGDFAAHYNRRNGNNDGGYTPVCVGIQSGAAGANSCGTSVSEAQCLEAVQKLLPEGQAQGRTHLVAGSWGWVPPGCSVQSRFTHGQNGDWAAHYNRRNGNNDGGYSTVCFDLAAHYNFGEAQTGNSCPHGSDVSEADCLAAAQSLLADGQTQGRTSLVAGSWGWVPPGCSVQSHRTHGHNGDFAAHYNRGNGQNDGGYTKVCAAQCQHLHDRDVVGGTFQHVETHGFTAPSDDACSAACTANSACTAWVRQPTTNRCWLSSQAVVTFESDSDRTTGLRCN